MSRYIDAELLKQILKPIEWGTPDERWIPEHEIGAMLDYFPVADVVEVVRCKDCKYQNKGQNECESWNMCEYRSWLYFPVNDDDYCSKGERWNE